jgi:rhamnosyltransferase
MRNSLEVSVVIPTCNSKDQIIGTLSSVVGQDTDFEFNVVIIDYGSTDGTLNVIKRVQRSDNRVNLYEIPHKNFSHSGTRNLAASKTESRFIVFITADALPADRYWLRNLIKPFDLDEKIAGVFGCHLPYPSCFPLTARDIRNHMEGFNNHPNVVWMEDIERYSHDLGYKQFLHFYSDNNSCMRRDVWKKIPYPPVEWGEDQCWAKAIIEAGYKKAYAPDACVYHSHNYSFFERIRRFKVEREFWFKEFGYKGINTLWNLLYETFNSTRIDCKWWKKEYNSITVGAFIKIIFHNLSRFIGDYLGGF